MNLLINLRENMDNKNDNPNRSKPSHHQVKLNDKIEVNGHPILKGIGYKKLKPPSSTISSQKTIIHHEAKPSLN